MIGNVIKEITASRINPTEKKKKDIIRQEIPNNIAVIEIERFTPIFIGRVA